MALHQTETNLMARESEFLDLELDPAPELDRALNLTLAGKLLSPNRPSLSNLTYFASKQWECPNRLKAYDHGRGLYTFEFVLDADVMKVIQGGPWYVDGKLMLIQRVNPNLSINQLAFESTKIWVRIFDLPPKAFNSKFAEAIGNMLGKFCESDLHNEGSEMLVTVSRMPTVRKYLRIKVLIDLTTPLKRTQNIKLRNSIENRIDEFTTRLAYERLPLFCLRCGLLGHDLESCSVEGPIIYDEWIRAEKSYRTLTGNAQVEPIPDPPIQPPNISDNDTLNPNPLTLDPDIILANFRQYREEGTLPPIPFNRDFPLFGSFGQEVVPFENEISCFPVTQGCNTSFVPDNPRHSVPISSAGLACSILGPQPSAKGAPALPPTHPNLHVSSKGLAPNYYNLTLPCPEFFSPSSQRCLFNSALIHPSLSSTTKGAATSPPELSPISALPPPLYSPTRIKNKGQPATEGDTKGKAVAASRGKRPATSSSKGGESPRPKRGRPPAGTSKNA